MKKDNPMDKLEYEEPKVVDLQIEQRNAQGGEGCMPGSGEVGCSGGMADVPMPYIEGSGGA